jgi:virginiamycin B lyase
MPTLRLPALIAGLAIATPALAQSIAEFPIPTAGADPFVIAPGPDGALWFTEFAGNKIGRISTAGAISEFDVPTAAAQPFSIVAGPEGNLWFTETNGNKIGRITPAGAVTEFESGGNPGGIALGPDGAIWFTQIGGGMIGRLDPRSGMMISFPIATAEPVPHQIAAGRDGALWFAEVGGNKIGRITVGGDLDEFPLPTPDAEPFGITAGPDGNLWFTELNVDRIGRITPAGIITEFDLPTAGSQPALLTTGSDGALWFGETAGGRIGRIDTAGAITEFTIPTAASEPQGITAGPDGNLWFVEEAGNKVARLTPAPSGSSLVASVLPSSRSVAVGATATAFATIINGGTGVAQGCALSPVTSVPAAFSFQATDPATNAPVGTPNTPVSIDSGKAQSFVIAFATDTAFVPIDATLGFSCADAPAAPTGAGLNTLLLSASATPVPDLVALVATPSGDGILDLASPSAANALSVAAINLGASSAITASVDTGDADLPIVLAICETDPATGACVSAFASSIAVTVDGGSTPTFSVFATAQGTIPFAPAGNRIFIRFTDPAGAIRGLTSVAVQTE